MRVTSSIQHGQLYPEIKDFVYGAGRFRGIRLSPRQSLCGSLP